MTGPPRVILVGEEKMKELGLKPLARIVAFADASQAPEWFTTTPIKAMANAFKRRDVSAKQMD